MTYLGTKVVVEVVVVELLEVGVVELVGGSCRIGGSATWREAGRGFKPVDGEGVGVYVVLDGRFASIASR